MNRKKITTVVLCLVFTGLACSININLPEEINLPNTEIKTGPTETEDINILSPDANNIDLDIKFLGGELSIRPGSEDALVSGTATYNVVDFKPEISTSDNSVAIEQGSLELDTFPQFGDKVINKWDLTLSDKILNLTIEAGGYIGAYDLGGLNIKNLSLEDGASDVDLTFSTPNQTEMENFEYKTGASNIEMTLLGNANFENMTFQSGAGNYTLDYSGELKRDATVKITSGLSSIKIVVPEGTSAEVTFQGGLSNINTSGSWSKSGDSYNLSGNGPNLKITIEMGAGNLDLQTSP